MRTDLRLFIPARHDVQHAGEEPGLNTAEKESHGKHPFIVVGRRHARANGAPNNHQAWKVE